MVSGNWCVGIAIRFQLIVVALADRFGKDNIEVADHYSGRTNQSFKKRRESPILALKNFNNWVKSILIQVWARRDDFALDIGGGKGGDLNKWDKVDVWHLVLAGTRGRAIEIFAI